MYTISKEFHFSASHILKGLSDDHPCSRLHGHNYIITVELQDHKLNRTGFVTDYRKLGPIKDYIDDFLDHRHLNDVFGFNPSAENMAKFLFYKFRNGIPLWLYPQITAVTVKETPKTAATYTPIDDPQPNKIEDYELPTDWF